MKLYAQYKDKLVSIDYINPPNLFSIDSPSSRYDYTVFEVEGEGVIASKDFGSIEKLSIDIGIAMVAAGISGENVTVTAVEFVLYSIHGVIFTLSVPVEFKLNDIKTAIDVSGFKLMPMAYNDILLKVNVFGDKTQPGKSSVAIWHSRARSETYVTVPTLEPKPIEVELKPKRTTTKLIDYTSRGVTGSETVIDVKGSGYLDVMTVRAQTSGFGVSIFIDDNKEFKKSYSDLLTYNNELDVSAYFLNGFVISAGDYKFKNKLKVILTAEGTVQFDRIYAKYEVDE